MYSSFFYAYKCHMHDTDFEFKYFYFISHITCYRYSLSDNVNKFCTSTNFGLASFLIIIQLLDCLKCMSLLYSLYIDFQTLSMVLLNWFGVNGLIPCWFVELSITTSVYVSKVGSWPCQPHTQWTAEEFGLAGYVYNFNPSWIIKLDIDYGFSSGLMQLTH